MCDCINNTVEKIKNHVSNQAGEIAKDSLRVKFRNCVNALPDLREVLSFPVDIAYRRVKNSGEPYKNMTRDSVLLKASFCPFCGEDQRPQSNKNGEQEND